MDKNNSGKIQPNSIVIGSGSKMKNVIIIFIILVVAIISTGILLSITSDPKSNNNQTPDSLNEDDEDDEGNEVDVDEDEEETFKFAAINFDDTVSYFDSEDSEIFISIDHKQWKALSSSPDKQIISALAKSSEGSYDIYLYNFKDKKLERITNFNSEGVGVKKYFWNSNTKLYFHQGAGVDSWLYSYDLNSKQLVKIERILGELHAINSTNDLVAFRDQDKFTFHNLSGDKLWEFTSLKNQSGDNIGKISSIQFTNSDEKLLAKTQDGKLYKFNFENDLAVEVTSELDFNIVCVPTEDLALGYQYSREFETLLFSKLNTKTNDVDVIAQIKAAFDDIQEDSFICEDLKVMYFRISSEDRVDLQPGANIAEALTDLNNWYQATEEGIVKMDLLKHSKYIIFNNEQ